MIHSDGLYRSPVHRGQDRPRPSTMLQEHSRLPGLEHDLRLQGLKRVPRPHRNFYRHFFFIIFIHLLLRKGGFYLLFMRIHSDALWARHASNRHIDTDAFTNLVFFFRGGHGILGINGQRKATILFFYGMTRSFYYDTHIYIHIPMDRFHQLVIS